MLNLAYSLKFWLMGDFHSHFYDWVAWDNNNLPHRHAQDVQTRCIGSFYQFLIHIHNRIALLCPRGIKERNDTYRFD